MQIVVGSVVMLVGLVAALGYVPLQLYTLARYRGNWRALAVLPAVVMLPIVFLTIKAYLQQSNLWPITLIFGAPVCTGYLLLLMLVRRRSTLER